MRQRAFWVFASLLVAAFGATSVGCTDGDKNGSEPDVYSWGFEEPIGSDSSEARLAVSASLLGSDMMASGPITTHLEPVGRCPS